MYTINELSEAATKLFGTTSWAVTAALTGHGERFTLDQARTLIVAFLNTPAEVE